MQELLKCFPSRKIKLKPEGVKCKKKMVSKEISKLVDKERTYVNNEGQYKSVTIKITNL